MPVPVNSNVIRGETVLHIADRGGALSASHILAHAPWIVGDLDIDDRGGGDSQRMVITLVHESY